MIGIFRANLSRVSVYGLILMAMLFSGCRSESDHSVQHDAPTVFNESGKDGKLTRVRFLPYWVTTAQFAGYYVGLEKGIYQKYGIDLEIIPFQPFVTSYDELNGQDVTFAAIWLANAIEIRDGGLDIVNIAQPSIQSSLMLITKKSSNINTIEQMSGKKAGIWTGYEFQPMALFRKYQVDVRIVPIGSTNNLFLKGGVDITIANWFDEYHAILNSGLDADEMNTFFFKDYGLNFLEDGIYCLDSVRQANPELCKAFVLATFESWQYAFSNPEEAISIVIKHGKAQKIPTNKVHQRWMLDRYKDLYMPPGQQKINTDLNPDDYANIGNLLKEQGMIQSLTPFEKFFKPVIID